MSKVQLQGNVSGTGVFTIASPNSNTDRTLTLPDNSGTVLTSGNPVSATTGTFSGIIQANGGGIQFPATQVPRADANTLDDYEECTWTPSVGGNATYTQQAGSYRKIGGLVYVTGILQVSTLGTGSSSVISGFPFTCNAGPRNTLSVAYWGSAVGSLSYLAFYIGTGTSAGTMAVTTAASTVQDAYGVFSNGTYVIFSGCYHSS